MPRGRWSLFAEVQLMYSKLQIITSSSGFILGLAMVEEE
jgi:hypothetical protein